MLWSVVFHCCYQVNSCVPNPDLLGVIFCLHGRAERLSVACLKTCQHLRHIVHLELIGQGSEAIKLVQLEGDS